MAYTDADYERATRLEKWKNRAVVVGFWVFVIVVGATGPTLVFWGAHDDSDPPNGGRSGMTLRTDNLTGCQYLDGGFALTPRLDGAGKQVGCYHAAVAQ